MDNKKKEEQILSFEVVGDIRIKEPKKKSKKNDMSIAKKIFIWFMFIAMLASFVGPLLYYLFSVISAN